MSVAASAAVDLWDGSIDLLRSAIGWHPRPPALVSLKFETEPTVRVLTPLRIEMRRTAFAHVLIEQDQGVLFDGPVPKDGRIGVMAMMPEPIRVRLAQEGRDPAARHGTAITETAFEPLPNGPPIERFDAPANVMLGGRIVIAWDAPRADRVRLAVLDDGEVTDIVGPATGQQIVPAARPGQVLLRLTAETAWGSTTLTREVVVVPPALELIPLSPAVQSGCPGRALRFAFKAAGAQSLWLIGPDDDTPQRLDKDGGVLAVTLGLEPAEFEVIARGYGGAERSIVLRAVPDLLAGLETNHQ